MAQAAACHPTLSLTLTLTLSLTLTLTPVLPRELHAIHDGLDCATFSSMARDKSARFPSNFYAGTSPKACDTNLRLHMLIAFHRFMCSP